MGYENITETQTANKGPEAKTGKTVTDGNKKYHHNKKDGSSNSESDDESDGLSGFKNKFPRLYTPKETAKILNVTEKTLAVWRCVKRYDLPYLKIGSRVFYTEGGIEYFFANNIVGGAESDI